MTVRKVTKIDSYIDDSDVDVDVLEIENEEEFAPRSSTVQSGWAGAQKLFANNSTKPQNKTAWEFKVTEVFTIVRYNYRDYNNFNVLCRQCIISHLLHIRNVHCKCSL
jgi:hypothetical protein